MRYAGNTYLQLENGPFACRHIGGSAVCADGKVRALRFSNGIADTFFSIPCSVQVKGKTVAGFATVETIQGFSTPTDGDPLCVKFVAHAYGRNANMLPRGAFKKEATKAA